MKKILAITAIGIMVTGCTTVAPTVSVTGIPDNRPAISRTELLDISIPSVWYLKTGPEGLTADTLSGIGGILRSLGASSADIARWTGRLVFGSVIAPVAPVTVPVVAPAPAPAAQTIPQSVAAPKPIPVSAPAPTTPTATAIPAMP